MQSTGHSSTHARSRTSTHGRAITYVTLVLHAWVGTPISRPTSRDKYYPRGGIRRTGPVRHIGGSRQPHISRVNPRHPVLPAQSRAWSAGGRPRADRWTRPRSANPAPAAP